MLATIIIFTIAFGYLAYETKWFTIRLLVGKLPIVDNWTPYYKELLARDNRPHYNVSRTSAEWDIYNEQHKEELEREQDEYRKAVELRESHTCHICKEYYENIIIETREIKMGNSTCHVRGCPDCIAKFFKEIDNSQFGAIKKTAVKTTQLPLFEYKHQERIGSHAEYTRWNNETQEFETSDKYIKGYSKRIVEEYETVYHDCLVSKEWLKEHENFEMPEPTIEISINDKTLPVNGNYKKGLIAGFMEQYTERVRVGKKTITAIKASVQ